MCPPEDHDGRAAGPRGPPRTSGPLPLCGRDPGGDHLSAHVFRSAPGAVWVHGAGEAPRLGWGGLLLPGLVRAGVVVLSYDKRGVGESEGECCPGDTGHFNLLTADSVGAVQALRRRPEVDPLRVGLVGASQAGWVVPRAAIDSRAAFVALAAAPPLPSARLTSTSGWRRVRRATFPGKRSRIDFEPRAQGDSTRGHTWPR